MDKYRFDSDFIEEFETDHEALEYANTWHDERCATIEKLIDGHWLFHSDPVWQPQFYYGNQDGGWMISETEIIPS